LIASRYTAWLIHQERSMFSRQPVLTLLLGLGLYACSDGSGPEEDSAVFRQVSVGDASVCAVTESGAGYCWGRTFGDFAESDSVPTRYGGNQNFLQLSAAQGIFGNYVCGLAAQAGTLCQGIMLVGYDIGYEISSTLAPLAHDIALDTVATSSSHFCGLTDQGIAWCWGDLNVGMRGTGQPEGSAWSLEPNQVAGGLTFSTIGAGVSHTCASTGEGAVFCWGTGTRLGAPSAALDTSSANCGLSVLGGAPCAHSPVQTELPAAARALFVGESATCAVTVDGELWCWGALFGRPAETVVPELVDAPAGVSSVALGASHGCILTTAGVAHCLGLNDVGQLGNGSFGVAQSVPIAVAGNLRFTALSASANTTCGLTAEGLLYCWGGNFQGQLGTGDREHRAAPVRVRLP
jgi:alpha-tubulin suppressor-like RCC1 family protein